MTRDALPKSAWDKLPQLTKDYIHDLETNADPGGTVQDLFAAKQNIEVLTAQLAEAEAKLADYPRLRWYRHNHSRIRVGTTAFKGGACEYVIDDAFRLYSSIDAAIDEGMAVDGEKADA